MASPLHHGWGFAYKRPHTSLFPLEQATRAFSPAPLCDISVFLPGTTTPVTLYADAMGTTPLANPFVADAYAFFSFYTNVPAADVRFSGTGITIPYTIGNFIFEGGCGSCFNVLAYGATGDGSTDDQPALDLLANTTIQPNGASLCFPEGAYRIASDITFPLNAILRFDQNAILVPDANVTITILGPVDAMPSQIFDTSASGSLIKFINPSRTVRSPTPHVYPSWWGANGNNAPYDTHCVQEALNQSLPVLFDRSYYVTSVIWQTDPNGGRCELVDGNDWAVIGIANTPTDAVFVFNHSFATLRQLWVHGNFNENYGCAFQFTTTNVQNGPLFNDIVDLHIGYALVGLAIGTPPPGFPGAGDNIYGTPGDCFTDLFITDCQICIYCNLRNAKFTFTNSRMLCSGIQWENVNPGVYSQANSCIVWNVPPDLGTTAIGGGELAFFGGELYNAEPGSEVGSGIKGINILVDGAIWEVGGFNFIGFGTVDVPYYSRVTLRDLLDSGNGNGSHTAFIIDQLGIGRLIFDNCNWNLSPGSAASSVGCLVDGTFAPNFTVEFVNCEIVEWPWTYVSTGAVLGTLVKGCRMIWRDSRWATFAPVFDSVGNGPIGSNLISMTADTTGSTMSTTADQTTKNGWTWAGDGNPADTFHGEVGDLPLYDNYYAAIQVNSVGGGVARILTPTGVNGFRLNTTQNQGICVFQGDMKVPVAIGTASMYMLFYRWDGSASVLDPIQHLFGDDMTIANFAPTDWIRFNIKVTPPTDAVFAAVQLQTTNGATLMVTGLAL